LPVRQAPLPRGVESPGRYPGRRAASARGLPPCAPGRLAGRASGYSAAPLVSMPLRTCPYCGVRRFQVRPDPIDLLPRGGEPALCRQHDRGVHAHLTIAGPEFDRPREIKRLPATGRRAREVSEITQSVGSSGLISSAQEVLFGLGEEPGRPGCAQTVVGVAEIGVSAGVSQYRDSAGSRPGLRVRSRLVQSRGSPGPPGLRDSGQ
jgi:hypothetical protein